MRSSLGQPVLCFWAKMFRRYLLRAYAGSLGTCSLLCLRMSADMLRIAGTLGACIPAPCVRTT
jgi:hypothetical protein